MTIGLHRFNIYLFLVLGWPSAQDARAESGQKKAPKKAIASCACIWKFPDNGDKSGVRARRNDKLRFR